MNIYLRPVTGFDVVSMEDASFFVFIFDIEISILPKCTKEIERCTNIAFRDAMFVSTAVSVPFELICFRNAFMNVWLFRIKTKIQLSIELKWIAFIVLFSCFYDVFVFTSNWLLCLIWYECFAFCVFIGQPSIKTKPDLISNQQKYSFFVGSFLIFCWLDMNALLFVFFWSAFDQKVFLFLLAIIF